MQGGLILLTRQRRLSGIPISRRKADKPVLHDLSHNELLFGTGEPAKSQVGLARGKGTGVCDRPKGLDLQTDTGRGF